MPDKDAEWVEFVARPSLGLQALHASFVTHRFERHTHDFFVLGTIDSGAPKVALGNGSFVAPPGHAMIINPGEMHDGHPADEKGYVYRMLYVDPLVIERFLEEFDRGAASSVMFERNVVDDREIVTGLRRLNHALLSRRDDLTIEGVLLDVLTPLVNRQTSARRGEERSWSDPRIEKVRDLIHDCYDTPLTTSDLAKAANVSRVHLNQLFRERYGLPPHAYVNMIRLAAAKERLRNGMTASEVAVSIGLSDQSHLIRRFRGAFGITPSQFVSGHLTDVQSRRRPHR